MVELEYERVSHAMLVTAEVKEKLQTLIQEPYRLSRAAVCDLNGDGIEDYVTAVYGPESDTGNDFEHPDQSMWMFLSDKEGGYKSKILTEEKFGYICGSLMFTAHGLLMSSNILDAGKYSSWNQEYFRYDHKTEEFYFIKSLQSKDYGNVVINMEDIGFYTIHDFYPAEYKKIDWQRDFKYEIKDEKGEAYNVEYDVVYPKSVLDNPVVLDLIKDDLEYEKEMKSKISEMIVEEHDYFVFDFNEDGLDDYLVCFHGISYTGSGGNSIEMYVQQEDGKFVERFSVTSKISLGLSREHAAIVVLNQRVDGYYSLVLPWTKNRVWSYDRGRERYKTYRYADKEQYTFFD